MQISSPRHLAISLLGLCVALIAACGASDSADGGAADDAGGAFDAGIGGGGKLYCGKTQPEIVTICKAKCQVGYPCIQGDSKTADIMRCEGNCDSKNLDAMTDQCVCAAIEYWQCLPKCPVNCDEYNPWGTCGDACDAAQSAKCPKS